MQSTQIVIVGGGYSGVIAARRLARKARQPVQITLVNGSNTFVERIRLHQTAAGQAIRQYSIPKLLGKTGATLEQAWVSRINPADHTVHLQTRDVERALSYDYLICAAGSTVDTTCVPGAAEYAHSVSTAATTQALAAQLAALARDGGRVVICGGGLTGIESASEWAETYPNLRFTLITREQFGAHLSQRGSAYLRAAFECLNIEVKDCTDIARITPSHVETSAGRIPFDLCVWAGAFTPSPLAAAAGLAVNGRSQALTDDHLRSISHPDIYGIGDAAHPGDAIATPIIMGCKTAVPMGIYAAEDLAARLSGKAHKPFQFSYSGHCVSLGRRDALVQFVNADNTLRESILTGWLGVQFKEAVCKSTILFTRYAA